MKVLGSAAAVAAATRDDALAEVERLERAADAERTAVAAGAGAVVDMPDREERIAEARRHARQMESDEDWAEAQEDLRIRDAWMGSVIARARGALEDAGDPANAEWFDALVEEAARHLPPGPCVVLAPRAAVASMTAERLQRLRDRIARDVSIEYEDIGGGCIVCTPDRIVAFDNTVDARQRRLEPVWRAALAQVYAQAVAQIGETRTTGAEVSR